MGQVKPRHREPKVGRCNAESVDSDGAYYCWGYREKGARTCKSHGGKTKRGTASPALGYRLTSRHAREEMVGIHRAMVASAEATRVDDDLATVELLIRAQAQRMDGDRQLTAKQEERLIALVEQKRRLVETRDRQAEKLRTMIPVEQVRALAVGMVSVIVDNIADPVLLGRIQRRIVQLVRGVDPSAPVIDLQRTADQGTLSMQTVG